MEHPHRTSPRNIWIRLWKIYEQKKTYHIGCLAQTFVIKVASCAPEGEVDENIRWNLLQFRQALEADGPWTQ
jgi:hypothetical protein